MKNVRIVLISPIRNEGEYLVAFIESLLNQSLLPTEWIIVDDGSSDNTWEIITQVAKKYEWIKSVKKSDRGVRSVGPGVVEAFYFGYNLIQSSTYEYLCKIDGDIILPPTYFESLLSLFDSNPALGAASGKPYIEVDGKLIAERTNDEMVAGQINFYRKPCFDSIGGFVREVHWDAIAFHRARMEGWITYSLDAPELRFIHQRLMGSSHLGILTGRKRWGKGQYFIGTHPLYLIAIGCYRALERPYIIGGIYIILGYIQAMINKMPRYQYPNFRKSLRAWQLERLKLGKRLETIN